MTNKQVAEAFANGETSGRSNNMFIQDGVIYSYGLHFPIARRLVCGKVTAFTSKGYSVTTAKHKSCVKSALLRAGWTLLNMEEYDVKH